MSDCGKFPDYKPCQLLCSLNTNGGNFFTLPDLQAYCGGLPDCVNYYFKCSSYEASSSSSFDESEFVSNAVKGFEDFYSVFVLIFACFCITKLVNMVK